MEAAAEAAALWRPASELLRHAQAAKDCGDNRLAAKFAFAATMHAAGRGAGDQANPKYSLSDAEAERAMAIFTGLMNEVDLGGISQEVTAELSDDSKQPKGNYSDVAAVAEQAAAEVPSLAAEMDKMSVAAEAAQPAAPAPKPATDAPKLKLGKGSRVRLEGLVGRADLNGCEGFIESATEDKGRYTIKVPPIAATTHCRPLPPYLPHPTPDPRPRPRPDPRADPALNPNPRQVQQMGKKDEWLSLKPTNAALPPPTRVRLTGLVQA